MPTRRPSAPTCTSCGRRAGMSQAHGRRSRMTSTAATRRPGSGPARSRPAAAVLAHPAHGGIDAEVRAAVDARAPADAARRALLRHSTARICTHSPWWKGTSTSTFFAEHFGADWHANGITMLREPVARTVSQARHIRARPGPFQEQLQEPRGGAGWRVRARAAARRTCRRSTSRARHLDAPQVDAGALAAAKANLDRLAFGDHRAVRQRRWRCSWSGLGSGSRSSTSRTCHAARTTTTCCRTSSDARSLAVTTISTGSCTRYAVRAAAAAHRRSYAHALLDTPGDDARARRDLRFRRQHVEQEIRLPGGERCRGAVLGLGAARRPARPTPRCVGVGGRCDPARPADRAQRRGARHPQPAQPDRGRGRHAAGAARRSARSSSFAFDRSAALAGPAHARRSCASTRQPLTARLPPR